MKSVLIVGGGPSGLVAAKTLLEYAGGTKYKVTLFEAADKVGGMWRSSPGEKGEICSPHMRTNLSRFTVAFPDLAWGSVDLTDPITGAKPSGPPAIFPPAWQVGRYLQTYVNKFLASGIVHCNRRVTVADFEGGLGGTWNVTSVDQTTRQESKDSFDYLIVASGFFHRAGPKIRQSQMQHGSGKRIQHSSQFRDVASFSEDAGKVVVVGGGISGSEAAATAAFQISNAKHSSGQKPAWADSKVYHVFDRPFYTLPRYVPQDPYDPAIQDFNLSPRFLPLDLILYNLGRRGGDGPITASIGQVPAEKAEKGHEFIRNLLGGDQRATGRLELVSKPDKIQYPAYTGVTDMYAEFVRDGTIVPINGRVVNITQGASKDFSLEVAAQGPWANANEPTSHLGDVTGVVEATGFQSHLNYLSEDVKQALEYDPDSHRVPFLLSHGSVFNEKVPNIAFVGFYEGPYWGVMSMQAKIIAQRWDHKTSPNTAFDTLDTSDALSVRQAIKDGKLDVPQFWMADYVGLMEEFAQRVGLQRDDSALGAGGPLFPARYQDEAEERTEAAAAVCEVAEVLQRSEKEGLFVAAAAFRGMQGTWTLRRKVGSRLPSMPNGVFEGTAHFNPRTPTDTIYSAEYLYIEDGTLTMSNGMKFPATRRYVYRYEESNDTVTAWFVDGDGLTVGDFFTRLEFYRPTDVEHGWMAKGRHWCSPDTYKSSCEFRFRGASLETFGITYEVTGPKKDYSHESWYSRPTPGLA
ncbi:uncharacterized protein N0V89_012506 [Didymosphaeria variabile]|uniref:FAD/NAD(P)-binding domain-containing protein n=1 Tax=Didymosphaeria variabile TaxID=1932322 RepID=A0A9W8X9A8_9PLEO|nr:uncharacterized protein N0V89_012506 [Didymosphaeria variabile]KAJ4344762.1 hypothetical protein N0V89_012506 [Didymosphaeria variabile]